MLAYYLLLGIPLFLSVINSLSVTNELNIERKTKNEKKIILVFFFIFFLLLAFRSIDMGADTLNYLYYFNHFGQNSWFYVFNYDGDVGYILLNKIIYSLGGDFRFFLMFVAFITVLPFAIFYYKESENSLFTISLFVNVSIFTMFFSGLRQTIAFSIGIIAFHYVRKKKKLAFLFWVFIAYTMHSTAFLLLILYPVYYLKITKNTFKFLVPVMAILFIFRAQAFTFLARFLEDENVTTVSTGAYTIFLMFAVFTVYAFVGIEEADVDENIIGLRNILVVATCLQMFASVHFLAMRANYYFIPFVPVLMSKISAKSGEVAEKNTVKFINGCLIVFYLVYFFYSAYTGEDTLRIYPYKPYWSE